MISPFLLEDTYNSCEGSYELNISSGVFPALSLVELLAFYAESTRLKVLESWLSLKLDYSEQYGLKRLRELIALSLREVSADNILLSTGASEAIYIVFKILCEKYSNATFIVQKPIYQSLYQVAADSGARIIDWNYDASLSAKDNISNLETLINDCSQLTGLVICNPNNPLGTVIPDRDLASIAELLAAKRAEGEPALLIADEVFRESSLVPVASAVTHDTDAIVISDLSKSFSLAGLRVGYIASRDHEFLAACSALKNYLSLRGSTLTELIACSAFEHAELIINRNRQIAATNLETLRASGIELDIHPDYIGGPVLFPYLDCQDREGLFILRGEVFGDYPDRIRIGFGSEPADFRRALAALEYKSCPKPQVIQL